MKGLSSWKICRRKFIKQAGQLPFTPAVGSNEVRTYHTLGGPQFHHPQVVTYGNTIENIASAVNRIDAARENETQLSANNVRLAPGHNRGLSRFLDSYYRKVRLQMSDELGRLGDELEEVIRSALDPTHPKFEIREKALMVLLRDKSMATDLFMDRVTYKLKLPEFAKAGKDGRGIGDFSTPGSLLAPFLVPVLKHAFASRIEHAGSVIRFVDSTNATQIDEIMTEMYHSGVSYFVFFSDDMLCKIVREGREEFFNLDISACDRSNTPSVFRRLEWFFGGTAWASLMERACAQCKQPLLIRNPENKEQWITAIVDFEKEFSGTILTTLLNNIASSAICLSIIHRLLSPSGDETATIISESAFAVGYVVTAEPCSGPEDLQFLKLSFWEDDFGNLHSFLNPGAVIRGFGTCWMDYPFRANRGETLEDAIRFRNWVTLQGYKNSGRNDLFDALLASPGCKRPEFYSDPRAVLSAEKERRFKSWDSESPREVVPLRAILARYSLLPEEWHELCAITRKADVGDVIHHRAALRILARDYGYSASLLL